MCGSDQSQGQPAAVARACAAILPRSSTTVPLKTAASLSAVSLSALSTRVVVDLTPSALASCPALSSSLAEVETNARVGLGARTRADARAGMEVEADD